MICMFYPSHCQNYLIFNITKIFMTAHRFFIKRCKYEEDERLLRWLYDEPKAHVIVVAAGRYDAEYLNYYTGRRVPYIVASNILSYSPPTTYSPTRDSFLYAPFKFRTYTESIIEQIHNACNRTGFNCSVVKNRSAVRGPFTLDDINSFRATIVFPYAVLSYYLADLIASAVPMFIPSPRMIVQEKVLTPRPRTLRTVERSGRNCRSIPTQLIPTPQRITIRKQWSTGFSMPCSTRRVPLCLIATMNWRG